MPMMRFDDPAAETTGKQKTDLPARHLVGCDDPGSSRGRTRPVQR